MTDEILALNSNNELVAKDPSTGNVRPVQVADLSASGDVSATNVTADTQMNSSSTRPDVFADTVDANQLSGVSVGGIKTKTRAFLSSNSSADPIPLDSVSYDPDGNFDTSTHEYTVPATGTYTISFQARLTRSSAGKSVKLNLKQNGSTIIRCAAFSDGGKETIPGTDIQELSSGDTITVSNPQGEPLNGGSPEDTFFSISRLE